MNPRVLFFCFLFAQVSGSFFDVFRGAMSSVEASFEKLLTDVVADVRDTIDCTVIAVKHALEVGGKGSIEHNSKCSGELHESRITRVKEKKASYGIVSPPILVPELPAQRSSKEISKKLTEKINESVDHVKQELLGLIDIHDQTMDQIEKNRLAEISALLRRELNNLTDEVRSSLHSQRGGQPSADEIWNEIKSLHEIVLQHSKSEDAVEIQRILHEICNVLYPNSNQENLSSEENVDETYSLIEKELMKIKNEENAEEQVIPNKIEEVFETIVDSFGLDNNTIYSEVIGTGEIERQKRDYPANLQITTDYKADTIHIDIENSCIDCHPPNHILQIEPSTTTGIISILMNADKDKKKVNSSVSESNRIDKDYSDNNSLQYLVIKNVNKENNSNNSISNSFINKLLPKVLQQNRTENTLKKDNASSEKFLAPIQVANNHNLTSKVINRLLDSTGNLTHTDTTIELSTISNIISLPDFTNVKTEITNNSSVSILQLLIPNTTIDDTEEKYKLHRSVPGNIKLTNISAPLIDNGIFEKDTSLSRSPLLQMINNPGRKVISNNVSNMKNNSTEHTLQKLDINILVNDTTFQTRSSDSILQRLIYNTENNSSSDSIVEYASPEAINDPVMSKVNITNNLASYQKSISLTDNITNIDQESPKSPEYQNSLGVTLASEKTYNVINSLTDTNNFLTKSTIEFDSNFVQNHDYNYLSPIEMASESYNDFISFDDFYSQIIPKSLEVHAQESRDIMQQLLTISIDLDNENVGNTYVDNYLDGSPFILETENDGEISSADDILLQFVPENVKIATQEAHGIMEISHYSESLTSDLFQEAEDDVTSVFDNLL